MKNLLIQEGFEFEEVHGGSSYDLVISPQYLDGEGWTISYPNSDKSPATFEIGNEIYTMDIYDDISSEAIVKAGDTILVGASGENVFVNFPLFDIFADAYGFVFFNNNLDRLRKIFYKTIEFVAIKTGKELLTKWYFPNTSEAAMVVTHDIDASFNYRNLEKKNRVNAQVLARLPFKKYISYFMRKLPPNIRHLLFPSVLSFDEIYNYQSTIFLRTLYQKEETITKRGEYKVDSSIKNLGHEIGLHFGATLGKNFAGGYVDPKIYDDPTEPWIEGISKSKKELDKFVKSKGCRSHHGHIFIPDSLDVIEDNFLYDSSLYCELAVHRKRSFKDNKVYLDNYRSPNGIYFPFFPIHNKMYSFVEAPVTHLECFDENRLKMSLEEIRSVNGVACGLYHPNVDIRGLLNFLKVGRKNNFWMPTLGELAEWFMYRSKKDLKRCPVIRVGGKTTKRKKKKLISVGGYTLEDRRNESTFLKEEYS